MITQNALPYVRIFKRTFPVGGEVKGHRVIAYLMPHGEVKGHRVIAYLIPH